MDIKSSQIAHGEWKNCHQNDCHWNLVRTKHLSLNCYPCPQNSGEFCIFAFFWLNISCTSLLMRFLHCHNWQRIDKPRPHQQWHLSDLTCQKHTNGILEKSDNNSWRVSNTPAPSCVSNVKLFSHFSLSGRLPAYGWRLQARLT